MKFAKLVTAVDSHTEGQPTRVVLGGIPQIPGKTMLQKMQYMQEHLDDLRLLLIREPRGHNAMLSALLTSPTVPEADVGVLYLGHAGYATMCGHGSIGVATTLVELGMVEVREPETEIVLDTPAGLVRARVAVEHGRAKAVTFRNVPSFLYQSDAEVQVPGLGPVRLDVAWGGSFKAILPAATVGLEIRPERAAEIIACGIRIQEAASRQLQVRHPEKPGITGVESVLFSAEATHPEATLKNTLVYAGDLDRSPCGTGTCAKMAQLHAKGELALNQEFVHESIVGTLFRGKLIAETTVGPYRAVVPTVTGRAWVMDLAQFVLDPCDVFPAGFYVG